MCHLGVGLVRVEKPPPQEVGARAQIETAPVVKRQNLVAGGEGAARENKGQALTDPLTALRAPGEEGAATQQPAASAAASEAAQLMSTFRRRRQN